MSDIAELRQLSLHEASSEESLWLGTKLSVLESLKLELEADPIFGETVEKFFRELPFGIYSLLNFLLERFDNNGIASILINACVDAAAAQTEAGKKNFLLENMQVSRRISTQFKNTSTRGIFYGFTNLRGDVVEISADMAALLRNLNEYQLYVICKLLDCIEISNISAFPLLNELNSLVIAELAIPGLFQQNRALFTAVHSPRRQQLATELTEFTNPLEQRDYIEMIRLRGSQGLNLKERQLQQNVLGNLGKVAEVILRLRVESPDDKQLACLDSALQHYGRRSKGLAAWRNGKPRSDLDIAFNIENGTDLDLLDFTALGLAWILIRYSIPTFSRQDQSAMNAKLARYRPINNFDDIDETMRQINVRSLGTLVNGLLNSYPELNWEFITDAQSAYDNNDTDKLVEGIEKLAERLMEVNRDLIIDITLFLMTLHQIVGNPALGKLPTITKWNFPVAENGITYYVDGLCEDKEGFVDIYEFKSHAAFESVTNLPEAVREQLRRYVRILSRAEVQVRNVILVDAAAEGVHFQTFPANSFLET